METTVTPDVVAAALLRPYPSPGSPEELQLRQWIDDALYLIGRNPAAAGAATADVDYVVREAVVRYARAWRPDMARRSSVAVDDGRVEREFFAAVESLTIPDDLWEFVLPSGPGGSGAFSIRPGYAPDPGPCVRPPYFRPGEWW